MLFLGMMDFWIANEIHFSQVKPFQNKQYDPFDKVSSEPWIKVVLFSLDGSLDSFDAVEGAKELIDKMPRKFCLV